MFDPSISLTLRETVERELEHGERIEWMGTPRRIFFTKHATAAFLYAIPSTAFALFWTACAAWGVGNANNGPGLFRAFPLFGVPFILIGLGMLSSPIWAYRRATKTVYVITDRRAITFDGGVSSTTIRSYPPEKLTDVFRVEKADGSGDVIIARKAWRDWDGDRQSEDPGFLRVAEAKEVERKLRDLARQGGAFDNDAS